MRLSLATLSAARAGADLPAYDPAKLETGIVHLGLGAFARAHLATYTDDVLATEPGPWGIAGISLQRPDQRDRLAPQNGLYTTLLRDDERSSARIIGCLRETIVAPENPAAVLARIASPACRIVSLTVTEKGYCHDPATGLLQHDHPDIVHDRAHPDAPRSTIGVLTASLAARRRAGLPPITVLSCDNLPHNGQLLAGLVQEFAAVRDDRLAAWIAAEIAFPATMVDRIVPAATETDRHDAAMLTGLDDEAAVSHESFRQWVIKDRFAGPRPAWQRAGAELVADVAPYEHMKLRLLNGAHSALAYLGYLAGHDTIADVAADTLFRSYLHALWAEIIPVVPPPPGTDLQAYTEQLLARFANRAIRHRTWQIAADGSQKLPQRLLTTIRERLARGLPFPHLALAVAAWLRYVSGIDEHDRPINVRDPLAGPLQRTLRDADPRYHVDAVLGFDAIFGHDLSRAPQFVAALSAAYERLLGQGVRACLARLATIGA